MRTPPLILVVDDVPDNVEILQLRLESQGYEVATATDGEAALEVIRDQSPDLVLLDIMTRFIFITGGVVSSLGKGLSSASLGALLQARGFKLRMAKKSSMTVA